MWEEINLNILVLLAILIGVGLNNTVESERRLVMKMYLQHSLYMSLSRKMV